MAEAPEDLDEILLNFKNEISVATRKYHFRSYQNTFLGSEAVTLLAVQNSLTREAALALGRRLLAHGFFHHVARKHTLEDRKLFYRFAAEDDTSMSLPSRALTPVAAPVTPQNEIDDFSLDTQHKHAETQPTLFSRISFFNKKTPRSQIYVIGLSNSGKKTLFTQLGSIFQCARPKEASLSGFVTTHMKNKAHHLEFIEWDFERSMFQVARTFLSTAAAIIVTIDSTNREGLTREGDHGTSVQRFLDSLGRESKIRDVPLLLLATKCDMPEAMSLAELSEALNVESLLDEHAYSLVECDCTNINSVESAITFLVETGVVEPIDEFEGDDIKEDSKSQSRGVSPVPPDAPDEVVFVLGLQGSGKSAFLEKCGRGNTGLLSIAGFEFESVQTKFAMFYGWNYDQKYWQALRNFFVRAIAVVFVLDSTDRDRLSGDRQDTAQHYLFRLGRQDGLNVPFLILANKQNEEESIACDEMERALGLDEILPERPHRIFPCQLSNREDCGVDAGMLWLASQCENVPDFGTWANRHFSVA